MLFHRKGCGQKGDWMKDRGSLRGGWPAWQEEKYKSDIIKERKCCASRWNVKHLLKIETLKVQCLFASGFKQALWGAMRSQTIAGMWRGSDVCTLYRGQWDSGILWDSCEDKPSWGNKSHTSSTSSPKLFVPPSQIVRISDLIQAPVEKKHNTGT